MGDEVASEYYTRKLALERLIRRTKQLIVDIEWWNTHRVDQRPFDCDQDRITIDKATRCLRALEHEDWEGFESLNKELDGHLQRVIMENKKSIPQELSNGDC